MLPLAAVGTVGFALFAGRAMLYAGAGGTGYALGRKWGRKICEWSDSFEDRVRHAIQTQRDLQ